MERVLFPSLGHSLVYKNAHWVFASVQPCAFLATPRGTNTAPSTSTSPSTRHQGMVRAMHYEATTWGVWGEHCVAHGCLPLTIRLPPTPNSGVQFGSGGGTWNQYGTVSITMVSTNNMVSGYGTCALPGFGGDLPLTIQLASFPHSGVSFDGSGAGTWNQNGAVTITITSNSSPGAVSTGTRVAGQRALCLGTCVAAYMTACLALTIGGPPSRLGIWWQNMESKWCTHHHHLQQHRITGLW